MTSPHPLLGRRVQDVEVLAVTPPARPHTNVGLFQAIGGANTEEPGDLIATIRDRAAVAGCDAILVTSVDQSRPNLPAVEASCVVYNAPPPH